MRQTFLNARSPLRVLEKQLHGGLGRGNLGLVLAGHGVGKTSFLVGMALDHLFRGEQILHVALAHTVAHTRAYYDTVFEELASSTNLEDQAMIRAEVNRARSIRAYPAEGFGAAKLRAAVKLEEETGAKPGLVIVEGFDADQTSASELQELRALARELDTELWLSAACAGEKVSGLPGSLEAGRDLFGVILALEPEEDAVALRALKDHDNPDVAALRVVLHPKTLLLTRG